MHQVIYLFSLIHMRVIQHAYVQPSLISYLFSMNSTQLMLNL